MTVEMQWTEMMIDGSSMTYDHSDGAGFLHVQQNPDAFSSAQQVEINPGLIVDLDADGNVRGIETIGHEVSMVDLLRVLRLCRVKGE